MQRELISNRSTGELIRLQRRVACLTQKQLADKVQVTQSAVARWESDKADVALRHRQALCSALGVDLSLLFPAEAA